MRKVHLFGLLPGQFCTICLLFARYVGGIPVGIKKRIALDGVALLVLLVHSIIGTVRPQEEVAGQFLKDGERVGEVTGDLGIGGVLDQLIAWIHIRAANDHDVVLLARVGRLACPGGTTSCVAGSQMRGHGNAAQRDVIAVCQDAVDGAGGPARIDVEILALSACGNDRVVSTHDKDLSTGPLLQAGMASDMVGMSMAGQDDFYIRYFKTECGHRGLDERHRFWKAAVDQQVPLRCGDQVNGQCI